MSLCQFAPPSKKYGLVFESMFVSCNRILQNKVPTPYSLCVYPSTLKLVTVAVLLYGEWEGYISFLHSSVRVRSEYLHIWCKF